jgi:tetratricopeptide (TPR) repeat protein
MLMVGAASAARPPADYRSVVHGAAAAELEALNARGRFEDVRTFGDRFVDRVEPASLVLYEMAYAANRMGEIGPALRLYDRAIALDPELAVAFYDRGELHLIQGDVAQARADFEAAARLRPDHWAVHFRLAHLAGRQGQAGPFETHLLDALRHGFDFRTVLSDPDWQAWARDPALGRVLRRLIVVYSDETLYDQLKGAP